jgi:Trypsin-like peptidase domain/Effector-associated domain 1
MEKREKWEPEAFAQLLDRATTRVEQQLKSTPPDAVEGGPRYGPWFEAAAVHGTFLPEQLRLLEPDDGLDDLLSLSSSSTLGSDRRGWTLSEPVRIETLRQMRDSGRLARVVELNPAQADDRVGLALQRYVARPASGPGSGADLAEAVAADQACAWLRRSGLPGLPSAPALRQRIDWLALLEPFRHLAGEHFGGRKRELETLRNYVGVLPPGSLRGKTTRFVERVLNFRDKPPLLIYGPGGVGKSTLVARFILEHAEAVEQDHLPFAYLDFDRTDVDAAEPLTLLSEALRQLGIAYPDAYRAGEEIRRGWLNLLLEGKPPRRARSAAIRDFGILAAQLGVVDRPVLFVLDTFEEVQSRSVEWVEDIWSFLEELQSAVPRLRVCIAGRAQVGGHELQELLLSELDREAAVGYLHARGIKDGRLAERLADRFGGSPLTLKLAADVAELEDPEELDVSTRRFLRRVSAEVVQRQLYARILGHLHDADVRRLAHPGLVLRRLTPELILQVLAEPCGLAIDSLAEAEVLFAKLAREVSLVTFDGDGSLRHRPDLRPVMLQLLMSDEPEKTGRIHARAVSYYERRPAGPRERAEEIYHRLALGQTSREVDQRWMPGVEPYLSNTLIELGASQRAFLASRLGLVVDEETRQAADLEDWERLTASRVEPLLEDGKPDAALGLLADRSARSPGSPLVVLEATALGQLGRWTQGVALLDQEIDRAIEDGVPERALTLTLIYCELVQRARDRHLLAGALARLTECEEAMLRPQDELNVVAHRLALERTFGTPPAPEALQALRAAFDGIPDDVLLNTPRLARWAGWSFTGDDTARLARVLRLAELPRDDSALRTLAVALATFDGDHSRRLGREPGVLAAAAGVPVRGSLTVSWGEFFRAAGEAEMSDALRALLNAHDPVLPPPVIDALTNLLGFGLLMRLESEREAADATLEMRGEGREVPAPALRDVERALTAAFSGGDELRLLLRNRLDVSLDAIIPSGGDWATIVRALIAYVAQQGSVPELLAAAREAYPLDEGLLRASESLGVSTIVPSATLEQLAQARDGFDLHFAKERLAKIEGQVCRVEGAEGALGTGFLVGPDLVLTADHVLGAQNVVGASPHEVILRFDYKATADGRVVTPGTEYQMDMVVARAPFAAQPGRLGYALIQVSGSPGGQPIGGTQSQSRGALRRWIEILDPAPEPRPDDALLIVQHPRGEPLRLAYSEHGVMGTSSDGARLYHRLKTAPGSAGSPCLNARFEPVALHIGTASVDGGAPADSRVAVLLSSVLADLGRQGYGGWLGAAFA